MHLLFKRKTLLFFSLLISLVGASFAGEDPTKPVFVLSQEEFVKQRMVMVADLGKKIELMQDARACAEKSTTPVEFQACNQAFSDAIRAHLAEQAKQK